MNTLREHRLRDNCFKVGHIAKGCLQMSACYVEDCNKKHMTVIHPPTELSANRNIYVNRFRDGDSLPRSGEYRVIRSHAIRAGATSGDDGVTQRHAIGIGATSGSDSVTQHHAIGAGTTSGAYCDFQSHATGLRVTQLGPVQVTKVTVARQPRRVYASESFRSRYMTTNVRPPGQWLRYFSL